MNAVGPDVQCIQKDIVVAKVLWTYLSKKEGVFLTFYVYS